MIFVGCGTLRFSGLFSISSLFGSLFCTSCYLSIRPVLQGLYLFAALNTVALSRRQPASTSIFRGSCVGRNRGERNTVLVSIYVSASCIPFISFSLFLIDIDCAYPVLLNKNLTQPYKIVYVERWGYGSRFFISRNV